VDEVNANIWLTNTCAIPNKAKQNNFIIWKNKCKSWNQIVGVLGHMAECLQFKIVNKQMAD
jgi:tRNA A37 methylthiotransferase MiaB